MDIASILAGMRLRKAGPAMIALQMAVTVAILSNALFIVQQRLELTARTTGVDEEHLIVVENQWLDGQDLPARIQDDLLALRSLPNVVDAYVTNSVPLSNSGSTWPINVQDTQHRSTASSAAYYADDHTLQTLGLRLIAGQNFDATDIVEVADGEQLQPPPTIIITRTLAETLFADGAALGKTIFILPGTSTRIVGIVDRLQVPWVSANGWGSTFADNSSLVPMRPVSLSSMYVLRTRPGQVGATMRAAQLKLSQVNRSRTVNVRWLADARRQVYRDDRGLATLLTAVCSVLMAVTAFGIVGLASYWVTQRAPQIGIRRALGAPRSAIVGYFQTENLIIALAASALGCVLAVAINLWMVNNFAMNRLAFTYPLGAAALVILLGQLAVLRPALRASTIPPAIAARSTSA